MSDAPTWPRYAMPDGTSKGRRAVQIWEHGAPGCGMTQLLDAATRLPLHGGWMHYFQVQSFVDETGILLVALDPPR